MKEPPGREEHDPRLDCSAEFLRFQGCLIGQKLQPARDIPAVERVTDVDAGTNRRTWGSPLKHL
jgi:hypothetical protein